MAAGNGVYSNGVPNMEPKTMDESKGQDAGRPVCELRLCHECGEQARLIRCRTCTRLICFSCSRLTTPTGLCSECYDPDPVASASAITASGHDGYSVHRFAAAELERMAIAAYHEWVKEAGNTQDPDDPEGEIAAAIAIATDKATDNGGITVAQARPAARWAIAQLAPSTGTAPIGPFMRFELLGEHGLLAYALTLDAALKVRRPYMQVRDSVTGATH